MQIETFSNNNIDFKGYETILNRNTVNFYEKRLTALGQKCDILVVARKLPFWQRFFKGKEEIQLKVSNLHSYKGVHETLKAVMSEKELIKNPRLVTQKAVELAKELNFIE